MWSQVGIWSVTRHWLFGPVPDLMATLFEEVTRENFELFVTIGGLEEFTASGQTGSSSTAKKMLVVETTDLAAVRLNARRGHKLLQQNFSIVRCYESLTFTAAPTHRFWAP
uniref:Uncharacterized protein n=1 Tax=Cannabis sativa TaxID=3483 RepID=A0A803NVG8_CANSA